MMQLAVLESPKGVGSSARLPRDGDMIMLLNTVPLKKKSHQ
jgi:hypothetical protein